LYEIKKTSNKYSWKSFLYPYCLLLKFNLGKRSTFFNIIIPWIFWTMFWKCFRYLGKGDDSSSSFLYFLLQQHQSPIFGDCNNNLVWSTSGWCYLLIFPVPALSYSLSSYVILFLKINMYELITLAAIIYFYLSTYSRLR